VRELEQHRACEGASIVVGVAPRALVANQRTVGERPNILDLKDRVAKRPERLFGERDELGLADDALRHRRLCAGEVIDDIVGAQLGEPLVRTALQRVEVRGHDLRSCRRQRRKLERGRHLG
jgi:hypothetical protein